MHSNRLHRNFSLGSNPDLFDLLQGEHVRGPIIEFGGPRRRVRGDGLRLLDCSPVLQVGRYPGRPKSVTASRLRQPDGFSTDLDKTDNVRSQQRPFSCAEQ